MSLQTAIGTPIPGLASGSHWVGVELGRSVIRAGIYDAGFRYLGKIKFSTKLERGPAAVIGRMGRCIQYAADECDLRLDQICAVGVGVPGQVDPAKGRVVAAPSLGWENVALAPQLEQVLGMPVFVENNYGLGALGVHGVELSGRPGLFAVLFPGTHIGGALVTEGRLLPIAGWLATLEPSLPKHENILAVMPGEQFVGFRGKDFKKALRKGNKAVEQFVRDMAVRTGEVAAEILERFKPDTIAIGGGAIEEMRDELMDIIQNAIGRHAASPSAPGAQIYASSLGDYALLAGGALWAARQMSNGISVSDVSLAQA